MGSIVYLIHTHENIEMGFMYDRMIMYAQWIYIYKVNKSWEFECIIGSKGNDVYVIKLLINV